MAIADLAPTVMVGVGPLIGGGPGGIITGLGAAGFAGVGPTIHFDHHRFADGAASIAFRIALPLLGMLIGSSVQSCTNPPSFVPGLPCSTEGIWLGALAGMVATDAIDIGFLSRGDPGGAANALPLPALPPLASPVPHEVHVAVAFSF